MKRCMTGVVLLAARRVEMRNFGSLIWVLFLVGRVAVAQNNTPADVHLELRAPARAALGEPLEVTLRLASKAGRYQILVTNFDRSGRVLHYGFTSTDAAGKPVRDPVPQNALGGFGGGPVSYDTLAPDKPYEQTVTANEWVAFDAPGKYFLRGWAAIAYKSRADSGDPPIRAESGAVAIEITAPDEASRLARLERVENQWAAADNKSRELLLRDLRFMLDVRAIPLLVRGFEDTYPNTLLQSHKGLIALLNKAAVEAEVRRVLGDENHFISLSRTFAFLRLLGEVGATADYKQIKAQFAAKLAHLPVEKAAPALVDAMYGSQLDRASTESWRAVLRGAEVISSERRTKDNVLEMLRSEGLKDKFDRELAPDFAAVAKNEKIPGDFRLSALATAHRLGYEGERDLVAEDVMKLAPRLLRDDGVYGSQVPEAQLVLGDYRSREIAEKLLAHACRTEAEFVAVRASYRSVARRLRDFGLAATVGELKQSHACLSTAVLGKQNWVPGFALEEVFPLVQAIAKKSPTEAIPLMRAIPVAKKGEYTPRHEAIANLLARLEGKEAETWRSEIINGANETDLTSLLSGFSIAIEEEKSGRDRGFLPPQPEFALRRFPEILRLFLNSPSRDVRASAHYCLTRITGSGQFAYDAKRTLADDRSFLPKWNAWREQNRARFGQ